MGLLSRIVDAAADRVIASVVRRYRRHVEKPSHDTPRDVQPYAVFEGRIQLNQMVAPAITGEWDMGDYDPETGRRELKEPKEHLTSQPTRITTWIEDEENAQQLTVRWEKDRGKLKLIKAREGEIWRVEFYKVADAREVSVPTVSGSSPDGFSPFGGQPGGGFA